MFNKINIDTWQRQEHYQHYLVAARNSFNISKKIDITQLKKWTKENNLKFFPVMIYLIAKTVNRIPALKTTEFENELGFWEVANPSYTTFNEETKTFVNIWTKFSPVFLECYQAITADIDLYKSATALFPQTHQSPATISISSLPWIAYESFSLEIENNDFLLPVVTFSKYQLEGQILLINLSIRCNHAVTDGYHVGLFYSYIEEEIAALINQQSILK